MVPRTCMPGVERLCVCMCCRERSDPTQRTPRCLILRCGDMSPPCSASRPCGCGCGCGHVDGWPTGTDCGMECVCRLIFRFFGGMFVCGARVVGPLRLPVEGRGHRRRPPFRRRWRGLLGLSPPPQCAAVCAVKQPGRIQQHAVDTHNPLQMSRISSRETGGRVENAGYVSDRPVAARGATHKWVPALSSPLLRPEVGYEWG